jgi:hypothetical protein
MVDGGEAANLPAKIGSDEVVISFHDEGLLIGGDPAAVENYLQRLRHVAGRSMQVAGVDPASIGNAAGLLAGLAAMFGDAGKYVQLHPDSLTALRNGNVIPGTDGFFRMMTRSDDGQFLAQLQWKPTSLGPNVALSAQIVAVQIALQQSIAKVEDAVRRVEGKVDTVLGLAKATKAGDVLGNNRTISKMVDSLDEHGTLPQAYWESVASLGPSLNVTIEQLRNYVGRVLRSFDQSLAVQDRAEKLRNAVQNELLGEALSLLVVAEESLYKWQRLSLARIEATEPEQLLRAIDESRELLKLQLKEDAALYQEAMAILDRFAKADAIDGFRYRAVRELARQRAVLREELDAFAAARRNQVEKWEDFHIPGFLDAASAALDKASVSAGRVLTAAGEGIARLGERLTAPSEKTPDSSQKKAGDSRDGEKEAGKS